MNEEEKFRLYIETASPQRIFNDLRNMVEYEKTEDVDWDKFHRIIKSCHEIGRAEQVLKFRSYSFQRTLLHYLMDVEGGPTKEIIETVLEIDSDTIKVKDRDNQNCLHCGVKNGSSEEVMKLIVDAYPEGIMEIDYSDLTPLHLITSNTSLEVIKILVEKNPEVCIARTYQGLLPIHCARVEKVSDDIINYLSDITQKNMPKFLNTFDELMEIVTTTKKYGRREFQKSNDVDWDRFNNIIGALDADTAQQIITYEAINDSNETLLSCIFGVDGGVPKNVIDALFNSFPGSSDIIQKWMTFSMTFFELRNIITYIDKDNYRWTKKSEDIEWEKFNEIFDGLEGQTIMQVLTCKKVLNLNRNLLLPLLDIKGDNPSQRNVVNRILETCPEVIKAKAKEFNSNCLYKIIENNSSSKDVVQFIVDTFPEMILEKDCYDRTPLHCINSDTSLDIVKLIVEKEPKVAIMLDCWNKSILQLAREKKAPKEVIQYLLEVTGREKPPLDLPEYPEATHGGNGKVDPTCWGITLGQFNDFMDACQRNYVFWEIIKYHTPSRFKKSSYVSGYDLCDYFVKAYTAKKGSGVSLRINWKHARKAEIMISHPWGEDVEETSRSLNTSIEDESIVIWFCILANYQNEDSFGPSITEQLKMEPFKNVISIPDLKGMVVVHSSKTELYDRKWCVHEIDEALTKDVNIIVGCSGKYLDMVLFDGFKNDVDTAKATCSIKEDEELIDKIILSKEGGFDRLNRVIRKFRKKLLEKEEITVVFTPNDTDKDLFCINADYELRPLVDRFVCNDLKVKGITEDAGCIVTSLKLDNGQTHSKMTPNEFGNLMNEHKSETRTITFMKPKTKIKRHARSWLRIS